MELFAYKALMNDAGEFLTAEKAFLIIKEAGSGGITYPRQNFNDFWSAMTTVYILISGEDWN